MGGETGRRAPTAWPAAGGGGIARGGQVTSYAQGSWHEHFLICLLRIRIDGEWHRGRHVYIWDPERGAWVPAGGWWWVDRLRASLSRSLGGPPFAFQAAVLQL